MKNEFSIRLLDQNATLPDRDKVLERFRRLVVDRAPDGANPPPESEATPSSATTI